MGIGVAGSRGERDIWPSIEAGGQRRMAAPADQAPGFGCAVQQIVIHRFVIHNAYRRSNVSFRKEIP
jgi:hypothetical protein